MQKKKTRYLYKLISNEYSFHLKQIPLKCWKPLHQSCNAGDEVVVSLCIHQRHTSLTCINTLWGTAFPIRRVYHLWLMQLTSRRTNSSQQNVNSQRSSRDHTPSPLPVEAARICSLSDLRASFTLAQITQASLQTQAGVISAGVWRGVRVAILEAERRQMWREATARTTESFRKAAATTGWGSELKAFVVAGDGRAHLTRFGQTAPHGGGERSAESRGHFCFDRRTLW